MLAMNNRENQDSIAELGGILPLVGLTAIGGSTPEVCAQAVFALTEVSRSNKENQTSIADNGAISSLAALLRHGDSQPVKTEVSARSGRSRRNTRRTRRPRSPPPAPSLR